MESIGGAEIEVLIGPLISITGLKSQKFPPLNFKPFPTTNQHHNIVRGVMQHKDSLI